MKDKYALYLRKSQADQPDESIAEVLDKHRTMLMELADKMGVTIAQADIYEEVVSGESLYARPEMLRLLEQVEAGAYEGVFCMDIDRLGRGSMSEQGIILETFRLAETKIICPGKTYDLTNDADEELTEMKALFARFELKMIRKRMRRGLMQTIEAGGYIANQPYGYRKCTVGKLPSLEIDEEQAKFIRHIYKRYMEGVGAQTIAEELNAMGSVPNRSAKWNRNTVRGILRNPTYAGKIAWNRVKHYKPSKTNPRPRVEYKKMEDWIMVDGLHPAIIPWEDWQRAQEIRSGRYIPSQNHGQVANVMAGLIRCGNCGHNMQRMGQNSTGGARILCTARGCIASTKYELVEQRLLESLEHIRADLAVEMQQVKTPDISGLLVERRTVDSKLKKMAARIDTLHDLLEDGTYDRVTFKERMAKAEAEQDALRIRQTDIENRIQRATRRDKVIMLNQLTSVLQLYPNLTNEDKNQMLKSVIDFVIYHKEPKTCPTNFTLEVHLKDF